MIDSLICNYFNPINENNLDKDYFLDAASIWDGYQYQGKVGLFTLLKFTISKIYSKNLELELEWLEDFSIIDDGKYKSIHQVKAYGSSQLSAYSEAICDLALKLMGFIPLKVFFKFFPKKKKEKKQFLVKELRTILIKASIIDINGRILNKNMSLIKSLNFTNHELKSKENFIKKTITFYFKLNENLKDVDAFLHTIKPINFDTSELLKQPKIITLKSKNFVSSSEFDFILDKIRVYKDYEISRDCCPNTIKNLNIDIINKGYLKRGSKYLGYGNRDLAERIYKHFLELLDNHISQRHSDKIYGNQVRNSDGMLSIPKIRWSNLLQVILKSDELIDESTRKKKAFILKEEFNTLFQKEVGWLKRNISNEDELLKKYTRIRNRLEHISVKYPQEEFLEFCESISPRRNSKKFKLDGVRRILDPSAGIKNPYFKFFGEINEELGDGINHKFEFDKKFYLPTIIREKDGYDVSRDIVENDNAPDTVFETDFIITKELNGKTIQQFLNEITRDTTDDGMLEELEHRITKIKSIELIDVNTAIKLFNNDKSTEEDFS